MAVRDTLLLACGTADSRGALRLVFRDSFNILETDNTQQAMLFLRQNQQCIAAVLLDISSNEYGCLSVLPEMNRRSLLENIPVIVIASESVPQISAIAFEQGASDVVFSDYDPTELHHRVHTVIDLYRHKWHLEDVIKEQEFSLRHSNDAMVDALSSIIEYRSVESGQHILRVRRFTKILLDDIAHCCPEYKLTEDTIHIISSASALHDVGKIAISDAVLNKPGKLTPEEWEIMKSHPTSGCQIIQTLSDVGNEEYLRYAHNICHYHHERWNGGGYPEGISGDAIPICAQVVGLADVYDALTTKRVYKDAVSCEQAVNIILNGESGAFSPKLLECFKHVVSLFEAVAKEYADGTSPKAENFDVHLPGPDYQAGLDALQASQSKYLSLLHHVRSTAFEVNLDRKIFHAVYNPHLDLAPLTSCTSIEEATKLMFSLVIPEEHDKLKALLRTNFNEFMSGGNRRRVFYFHINSATSEQPNLYQLTLLRPDPSEEPHSLLALWQRSNEMPMTTSAQEATHNPYPDDAVHGLLTGLLRYRNDHWFTLESKNTRLAPILGYADEELHTKFNDHLVELIIPEDRERVHRVIDQQLSVGPSVSLVYRLRHKNGATVWALNKSHLVLEADGNEYLYGTLTDITYSQIVQQELHANLERYRLLLEQTNCVIFEWDPDTDSAYFSSQWKNFFGYDPLTSNLTARLSTESHFHPEDLSKMLQTFQSMKDGTTDSTVLEVRIANIDGRYHWIRFRGTAVRNARGTLLKMVGLIINIDDEREAVRTLQEQAEHDSLTWFLNKQTGRKKIEAYLSKFPQGANCAMILLDLDNFKQINDRFGHMFGDAVLTQAAKEIKSVFRATDIFTRIGGDEFMILMLKVANPALVEQRCAVLIENLQNMFQGQLENCPLGCSIGIALSPKHGLTYSELFKHADQALYHAKRGGKKQYHIYDLKSDLPLPKAESFSSLNAPIDSDQQPGLANQSIVQYSFSHLYESGDPEAAIQELLELIGQQLNVSRVYIFEDSSDHKTCSNTFEWCNTGISPQIQELQKISYERDIPNYPDNFDEYGIFYCPDISTLPPEIQKILEPQEVKSMLQCAFRDNGVFCGYMGFDECQANRYWTKDQVSTLVNFSETLSMFLLKKRAQDEVKRLQEELRLLKRDC